MIHITPRRRADQPLTHPYVGGALHHLQLRLGRVGCVAMATDARRLAKKDSLGERVTHWWAGKRASSALLLRAIRLQRHCGLRDCSSALLCARGG